MANPIRIAIDSSLLNYQVLSSLSDIEAIAPEWDVLLDRSLCNRAFSCASWYLAACRYNPEITPHLIVVRRGSNLLAILPLALADNGSTATFPTRFSDYNDIIAAADDLEVSASLLKHALTMADGYQKISLFNIRCDSNCLRAANLIWSPSALARIFRVNTGCQYALLPSSYDGYLASRSPKLRKNLRRALRDAARNNILIRELEPESFSPSELPEAFLSLQFHRQGDASCFASELSQSFVIEAVLRLFRERRLRAFALFQNGRMIAIDLYMMGTNSVCSWNGGFLSEAARWSPVKLLNNAAIKRAYELGLKEYDYLRGEHDYKRSWTNSRREVGRLEIDLRNYPRDKRPA